MIKAIANYEYILIAQDFCSFSTTARMQHNAGTVAET
jgi:hypothetical protein